MDNTITAIITIRVRTAAWSIFNPESTNVSSAIVAVLVFWDLFIWWFI